MPDLDKSYRVQVPHTSPFRRRNGISKDQPLNQPLSLSPHHPLFSVRVLQARETRSVPVALCSFQQSDSQTRGTRALARREKNVSDQIYDVSLTYIPLPHNDVPTQLWHAAYRLRGP